MISNEYLNNILVIFSVEQSNESFDYNLKSTATIEATLNDVGYAFKKVQGCYANNIETSFLVKISNGDNKLEQLDLIKRIAKLYNQESILLLSPFDRHATLHFIKTEQVLSLGKFTEVDRFEALEHKAWTRDLQTDTFYITKEV